MNRSIKTRCAAFVASLLVTAFPLRGEPERGGEHGREVSAHGYTLLPGRV